MKNIWVVCGLNASRSQMIEEFLKDKYKSNPEIRIKSAGLDVTLVREDDQRILFTEQTAREASLVLVSDHDKFYRIRYKLLNNDEKRIRKVHVLRIPDVFYTHRNAYLPGNGGLSYDEHIQRIESEPEFKELAQHIKKLSPKEASELTEALYTKELYSSHLPPNLRQDKKYPSGLLYKTLGFRSPWISRLIENIK
jgi:hypothetical protein